jgi:transcription elongation factor Elf1
MWCPRCEQGEVVKALINKKNSIIYVCEECEATWLTEADIGVKQFVDFGSHMKSLGLDPLWGEITISS